MRALAVVISGLYYVVPTFDPFADKTQVVNQTLRVAAIDWRYLLAGAGYAAIVCAFGYLATLVLLRRSQLT
jgi:hypothetical protein